jgi:hypothetical protein|tara:strand:- start:1244 stop:2053 length:810 start_codon:yes stop_codon:yes gene_type:complete
MPRRTYRNRLQDLVSNPSISPSDRGFAESLLSYYERKGSLTSGRVAWVKTLEDRYSPQNVAANTAKGAGMISRLESLRARTEPTSWAAGYVESLRGHIVAGRHLSKSQIEVLEKIEFEHNDEAMISRLSFIADYKENKNGMYDDIIVIARYYKPTTYFGSLVDKILEVKDFVPTYAEYNKLTKNKYAQKVLQQHKAEPKYLVGSYVTARVGNFPLKHACGGKPCIVVAVNALPIVSAAKGSKIYKLLPIGRAETVFAEERQIMKARKIK